MVQKRFFAGIWPVVQRELRESARRPVNHRLRWWSGVCAAVLLWAVAVNNAGKKSAEIGAWHLVSMHILLVGLIFLAVPLLAADCIAREKRDGTLGLLFLTPLSAGGIVAGKAIALGLRTFTLWLAVLPMLVVPFLEGGVNWVDASTAIIIEFCVAVLCLAAGLVASSLTARRNLAATLALAFAAIFLVTFATLFTTYFLVISGFSARPGVGTRIFEFPLLIVVSVALMGGAADFAGWYQVVTRIGTVQQWETVCAASPLIVLLIAWLIGRFAVRRIERSWQDKVPTVKRERLLQRYCTPLFRSRFHRKMQRALDANPIAWLQQYSWKARLSKWGLCGAVLAAGLILPAGEDSRMTRFQGIMIALAGAYSFVGVSGFLEEKQTGALELLLVTPISVNKLIFGRVWGLWKQFLPATLVALGFCYGGALGGVVRHILGHFFSFVGFGVDYTVNDSVITPSPEWLCIFLSLPVFATYFALRVKNLIAAYLLTWIAIGVPFCIVAEAQAWLVVSNNGYDIGSQIWTAAYFLSYGSFVLLTCFLLRHSLSRRIYPF